MNIVWPRRVIMVVLSTACIWLCGVDGYAQNIRVRWNGDPPLSVYLDRNGVAESLRLDDQEGVFALTIQAVTEPVVNATLAAQYSQIDTSSLPIRLFDYDSNLTVIFHRSRELVCSNAVVTRLEQSTINFQVALQAYFDARTLALRTDANRCGSIMRPRVIKAWFDRSYALASQNRHFRLDPDAVEAFRSNPQLTELYPSYTERYARLLDAAAVRIEFVAAQEAVRAGDHDMASRLYSRVSEQLTSDQALMADVERYEGLSLRIVALNRSQMLGDGN